MAKKQAEQAQEEKSKLELIKKKMEEKYGKGIIVSGRDKSDVETISTGSLSYDKITDCGGIPIGRIVEMYGPESSGKSTLALHTIAEFQKAGKKCIYCDFEYSFDRTYAEQIGVNVDDLIITQPDTMEDAYNIIYDYVKSGEIGLVVIDSHTAMVPKARLEGQIGDAKMAPEARINSEALKKLKSELSNNNCTLLGVSQLRANIGSMGSAGNVPTGGNAWKFYSDMRIKIFKILDKAHEANSTTIEIAKNKCGKPFGKTEISIAWGIGIDKMKEIIDLAVKYDIIKKAGSWYAYQESKLGQGTDSVKQLFSDNQELMEEIKTATLQKFNAEVLTIELSDEEKQKLQEE